MRVALLGFSSDPSLVGHRAFFLLKPKENVFHSSFSYLLDNLDHIEIHLICYSQYQFYFENPNFLVKFIPSPMLGFTPENIDVNVEHSYHLC